MFDEKGYLPSRFLISSFPVLSPKKYSSILCSFEKPPLNKQSRFKSEEKVDNDENIWDEGMRQKKKKKNLKELGFEESWEEGGKGKERWRKEKGVQKEENKDQKNRRNSNKLKECLFPSLQVENNEKEKQSEDSKDYCINLPPFITARTNIKSQQQSRQIKLIKQQIKSTFSLFKQLSDKARHRKNVMYSSKREDLYKQVKKIEENNNNEIIFFLAFIFSERERKKKKAFNNKGKNNLIK